MPFHSLQGGSIEQSVRRDAPFFGIPLYNGSMPNFRCSMVQGGAYFPTLVTYDRMPILAG
jgi:hypothetical protein